MVIASLVALLWRHRSATQSLYAVLLFAALSAMAFGVYRIVAVRGKGRWQSPVARIVGGVAIGCLVLLFVAVATVGAVWAMSR